LFGFVVRFAHNLFHLVFHSFLHSIKDQAILADKGAFRRNPTRIDFAMTPGVGDANTENAIHFSEKPAASPANGFGDADFNNDTAFL
jgi:hypothetical protein